MDERTGLDGLSILQQLYGDDECCSSLECEDDNLGNNNSPEISSNTEEQGHSKCQDTCKQCFYQDGGNKVTSSDSFKNASPASSLHSSISEEQESGSSAGKRKREEVPDQQLQGDAAIEDDKAGKKKKWASEAYCLMLLGPLKLPEFSEKVDIEADKGYNIQQLTTKLNEINEKLQTLQSTKEQFPETVEFCKELVMERQNVIASLVQENPIFGPPPDDKPLKFQKKLYIPQREYPGYNFFHLILGQGGSMKRKVQRETGARMVIRGRGSMKVQKWHKRRSVSQTMDTDDLHVLIEGKNQTSLDSAVAMVEKLLVPVKEKDYYEQIISENIIPKPRSGEFACPNKLVKLLMDSTFPLERADKFISERRNMKTSSKHFVEIARPGCGDYSSSSSILGSSSDTDIGNKVSKVVDPSNLYVGHLPLSVNENKLSSMFSEFGRTLDVNVVKDRTSGLSKGYGFVKFSNLQSAAKAIESMNGKKMEGKCLSVRVAFRKKSISTDSTGIEQPLPQLPGTTEWILPKYSSYTQPFAHHKGHGFCY